MSLYSLKGIPQEITLTTGSVASPRMFNAHYVLIRPTVNVYIAVGPNPTAVADGNICHFIGEGEMFPLQVEHTDKLAVIPATAVEAGGKVRISSIG